MSEIYTSKGTSTTRNELVLFLLDGSGSMRSPADTSNDRSPSKSSVLDEIVKGVLQRISESQSVNMFRVGFIKFANEPKVEQISNSENYFTVDEAIKILKPSTHGFAENEGTDIVKAFEKAIEITNEFCEDDDMASNKNCTLILCTDGKHFEHETDPIKQAEEIAKVGLIAEQFQSISISPNVACVALGSDADIDVLTGISTVPNLDQQKRFDKSQLLQHLKKDNSGQFRLCMVGHENNKIGNHQIATIRRFLIIGTKTEPHS